VMVDPERRAFAQLFLCAHTATFFFDARIAHLLNAMFVNMSLEYGFASSRATDLSAWVMRSVRTSGATRTATSAASSRFHSPSGSRSLTSRAPSAFPSG
jgi:hypothetical protein